MNTGKQRPERTAAALELLREAWRRTSALERGIQQTRSLLPHDLNTADGVMALAMENAQKAQIYIRKMAKVVTGGRS